MSKRLVLPQIARDLEHHQRDQLLSTLREKGSVTLGECTVREVCWSEKKSVEKEAIQWDSSVVIVALEESDGKVMNYLMEKPILEAVFVVKNSSSELGERFKKRFPHVYEMDQLGRFQREFQLKEVFEQSLLREERGERVEELISEAEQNFARTLQDLRRKTYKLKNIELDQVSLEEFRDLLKKVEVLSLWND